MGGKNLPLFLLYAALKFFCDFIKRFQKEEGEKLLSLYRDNIVNIGQTEHSKRQTQGEQPTPEQEMGYLLRLHQLIQKSLKQKCLRLDGSNFRLGGIAPITRAIPSF